jgi:hypothetical protein
MTKNLAISLAIIILTVICSCGASPDPILQNTTVKIKLKELIGAKLGELSIIETLTGDENPVLQESVEFNSVSEESEIRLILKSNNEQNNKDLQLTLINENEQQLIEIELKVDFIKETVSYSSVGAKLPPTLEPNLTPTSRPDETFDSSGNTTAFGIPNGLIGNIQRGRNKNQTDCAICHGERGKGLNFSQLKRRIGEPPMNLRIPDKDLADILAFLNR